MKNSLVCQLDFGCKIWGLDIGSDGRFVSGLANLPVNNPILGRFACYEGIFRQVLDKPHLHAIVHEAF